MRKSSRVLDRGTTREEGFEEGGTSPRDRVGDLSKFKGDLDRLRRASAEDLRNFCTDLNELGGAGGDLTKLARELIKLDRHKKIKKKHKAKKKYIYICKKDLPVFCDEIGSL